MPRIFNRSNKSQASLEKIQDPRDRSPALRQQEDQQRRQQQLHQPQQQHQPIQQAPQELGQAETAAYPQSTQTQYNSQATYQQHPPSQQQHYTIESSQPIAQDERYYQDQLQSAQQSQSQAQVLNRSSSHRLTTNAYSEQQQPSQRPTIALVNPNLQQESIAEDEHHQPGQTQFGVSQRLRTSGPKDEKKPRSTIRSLFGGSKDKKEGRDSPVDSSRLSRQSSILGRGKPALAQQQQQQQLPQSPTTQQHPSPQVSASPQQQSRSESIAAYQNHELQGSSQEDLSAEDAGQYEQYYRNTRPHSQYELPSQQEARRPSVQYEEDSSHHFSPQQTQTQAQAQAQQYHQPQAQHQHQHQQIYQHPNISGQFDPPSDERKGFFPYSGQPIRDRPSAVFAADESLRPPSQSSLGPPSPLGVPATLTPRQSTSNPPPRFSIQSVQAYQQAQQEASRIQAQAQSPQSQPQAQTQAPLARAPQGESQDQDMPNRADRDRQQRDSRMEEQDQRYQVQDPRVRMSTAQSHEQGRSTPPPRGREDAQQLDHQTLLLRYEELQAKYSKVKRYYFDREAQVTQLQNTVANQRLSMSKTSLDDAQYATRFERLNGAIQNLAFNIRKDWRRLPNWLAPACNRDACATGTKEMTAVGRACISRWIYEHIFQAIFHPGIDQALSQQLKSMERQLRRTPAMLTEEQRDDLLTKVTTWRLTTCEALGDILNSRQSEAYTETLSRELADELCLYLRTLLNDPPPPNLEGYLLPIVSQTLSIAANLPLESRDVCIDYYHPGTPINETFMKLETGMTTLVQPGSALTREEYDLQSPEDDDDEPKSMTSDTNQDDAVVQEQLREAVKAAQANSSNNTVTSSSSKDSSKRSKGGSWLSGGFSGGLVNKKPPSSTGRGPSQTDLAQKNEAEKKDDEHQWTFDVMVRGQKEGKIRFAVFLAVEVRGKSPSSANRIEGQQGNGNGSGIGEQKSTGSNGGPAGQSAGTGITGNGGGTSGGAGTGGVNVLVKAPVFGF